MEPDEQTHIEGLGRDVSQLPFALLRVKDAARLLAISESRVYELVASGELQSVPIGRSRRIPLAALERFVAERLSVSPE